MRADELAIHPTAQRDLIPSKLKRLETTLDLDAIGVLHAVEYPIRGRTKVWVIDGQHRLQALLNLGFGEWLVEVKIHTDVDNDARASALFLKLNDRAAVSTWDKWQNELKAKAEDAINADAIVRKHKLIVSKMCGDGKVACVSAIKKLYRADQGVSLDKTLSIVTQAWGSTAQALEGKLIEGIGHVVAKYNGTVDEPVMVTKLSKSSPPSALLGKAKMLGEHRKVTLSRAVAELVIETYNSGRRVGKLDPL